MAKRNTVDGKDIMLFISGKAVALATSSKFSLKSKIEETATKDDGQYSDKEQTGIDWNVSSEALYGADASTGATDMAFKELRTAMLAGTKVEVVFGTPANIADTGVPTAGWTAPTSGLKGNALIESIDITADKGSKAKMSISLQGCGALTEVTA